MTDTSPSEANIGKGGEADVYRLPDGRALVTERPGRVRIAIGEPISVAGYSHDDRALVAARAQEVVAQEIARMRDLA